MARGPLEIFLAGMANTVSRVPEAQEPLRWRLEREKKMSTMVAAFLNNSGWGDEKKIRFCERCNNIY